MTPQERLVMFTALVLLGSSIAQRVCEGSDNQTLTAVSTSDHVLSALKAIDDLFLHNYIIK